MNPNDIHGYLNNGYWTYTYTIPNSPATYEYVPNTAETEDEIELRLAQSGFDEANALIERIKHGIRD